MTEQERLELINGCCEYNIRNGIFVTRADEELCVVEAELRPDTLNPNGMAHGGFVYSICDVAAGTVVGVKQRSENFVTLSGNLYFLRPGKGRKLRCEARIIKPGRTVSVVETSVFDERGSITARGTFEIFTAEKK